MRSTNPALNMKAYDKARNYGLAKQMTLAGTANKTMILLGLAVLSAAFVWRKVIPAAGAGLEQYYAQPQAINVGPYMWGGLIGGLIFAMITIFKKEWAPVTAPLYALTEGLALGAISSMFEMQYPGIVIKAVGLTFGVLFCLLAGYRAGLIHVSDKFRAGVLAAGGAIFLVYLIDIIMGIFGARMPMIHESGALGIGFSMIVVGVASLFLVLDFDFIDKAADMGVPKFMEWYGAFSLMLTLVWLYLEILRLLSKLSSRE